MREPEKVSPEKVYERLKAGALFLVCAYEDESEFRKMHLEGVISLNEFKAKFPGWARDQEIIFY